MQQPVEISVIIPAYQEEKRIGNTIARLSSYLEENYPGSELILVCDGCTDRTAFIASQYFSAATCKLRIIQLPTNCGKGNAIKEGMLAGVGEYLFFTDADLSFAPEIIEQFLQRLKDGADLVIAQRQQTSTYSQPGRRALAVVSRSIIGNFILPGIRDTQAGFKAFRYQAAQSLFSHLHTKGYLFDLEILLAARRKRYRIEKIYVSWCDCPGSKISLVKDTICAGIELFSICMRELLMRVTKSV